MQIKINGKTYDLNFGIRWVLLMNQNHNISGNGLSQGMGINQAVASLSQYDPIGLSEILLIAFHAPDQSPRITAVIALIIPATALIAVEITVVIIFQTVLTIVVRIFQPAVNMVLMIFIPALITV